MELILPMLTVGGLGLYIYDNDRTNVDNSHPTPEPVKKSIDNNFKDQEREVSYKTQQQKYYENTTEEGLPGKFTSISGDNVKISDLKHNNMKPFFGSKVRQRGVNKESYILDNMQGSGSEQFRKQEQETLFKPTKDLGWNNGTPSSSDFIQSRMNPGVSKNNTKPWEEIQVGPGLNKGYNSGGSGGFNSSLESRGEWIDKNIDELRAVNNPKVTYDGVTLGGKRSVTNRGIEGKVEHYKPDKYYKNTQDRYLTTTGSSLAPSSRSKQHLGNTTRNETTTSYFGNSANTGIGNYIKGKNSPGFKQQLGTINEGAAYHGNKTKSNIDSYNILPNSRSITSENNIFGSIVGIAKEVILPLKETIRPSRKENVIGNLHMIGNVGGNTNNYVKNDQKAKTTTKETTATNERVANVGNGIPGTGYLTNTQSARNTQRTTTTRDYFGASGNTQQSTNNSNYGAYYNATTNANKEEISSSRPNMGNMNLFNNEYNMQITKQELQQDYEGPVNNTYNTPNTQSHGMLSSREPVRQDDRLGGELVSSLNSNPYNLSVTGK